MLQEMSQIPAKLTFVELGVGLGVAVLLVEKIIGWVSKLRGNGKKKSCIEDPRLCAAMQSVAESSRILGNVEKEHEHMINSLDGQTLVLDRIYQGQALQIKALDKIVEKLDRK